MIGKKELENLRAAYPAGTMIEMILMADDPRPIEPGSRGTVEVVDDMGDIHINWENGRRLAVIPGVDKFKIIK